MSVSKLLNLYKSINTFKHILIYKISNNISYACIKFQNTEKEIAAGKYYGLLNLNQVSKSSFVAVLVYIRRNL